MKLELIEWVDHWSFSDSGWKTFDKDVLDQVKPLAITSVGWILKENDEIILLVPHQHPHTEEANSEMRGCGELIILKSSITSRKELQDEL